MQLDLAVQFDAEARLVERGRLDAPVLRHRFAQLAGQHDDPELTEAVRHLSSLLQELHGDVLTVRMFPIATLTDRFPRMLRDVARQTGKELEFIFKQMKEKGINPNE